MSNVKVVLNRKGVRALLRSSEMLQICKDHAYETRAALGDGYEVTYRTGKNRVNAEIAATSSEAKRDNSRNNTILKALK